jgi:hypothetical protein
MTRFLLISEEFLRSLTFTSTENGTSLSAHKLQITDYKMAPQRGRS